MAEPTAVVEPVAVESTDEAQEVVTDDVLVEEVSIDGMCGVY
jgi:mycofactocin precursor